MKRKFSFNLAPVVPSKSDVKATPEPTPARPQSHRRHQSGDSITIGIDPLNSPFISRQKIDVQTERELRRACALILQNFKPSDHGLDADPKLDFQGMNRRRDREHKSGSEPVKVRRPTGAPAEAAGPRDARRLRDKADDVKYHPDLPMQANTGRRREGHSEHREKEKDAERGRSVRSPPQEVPRTATMDSDDAKSLGTPLTSSTDAHLNNASTAPTSAALTSGRSSKRDSHYLDNPAVADAQAAEWMRQELEKRRQQLTSQSSDPEQKAPARPPSRARSIKEFFSPGSRSLSRSQSRDSLRTTDSHASSQEPKRSGSAHGWRSWSLQRKSSSRTTSRPGTSGGRLGSQEPEKKAELNLNRELPPLPSLDSWNQQGETKPKEKRKSQAAGAHIATMMRPQEQQQQDYAAAVRRHHRRSGSDTLALRYTNTSHSHTPLPPAKSPSMKRPAPRTDASMDFDEMMSRMDSTHDLNSHLALHSPGRSYHEPSIQSPKQSSDRTHLELPNFSRKISSENARPTRSQGFDHAYHNVVQIAPHPDMRHQESKSVLKKVFGGWMKKGSSNAKTLEVNWMKQLERNGVKEGVMVLDEAAVAPVVRY
ncbi:hypothetical protein K491DRAFT_34583 [Lophiostoma macrostomum CBS 122681]|uniref:Uncharacterized protein n=1 Tax=Lophiostoma macrostomum CBS 122681 TaxID=1314788 RepID=A0A6A6SYG1_9PLEO|nr:hypothetical protein K491DRAFT_34583 [Lophiostoma macrostomum CBS 122681]